MHLDFIQKNMSVKNKLKNIFPHGGFHMCWTSKNVLKWNEKEEISMFTVGCSTNKTTQQETTIITKINSPQKKTMTSQISPGTMP